MSDTGRGGNLKLGTHGENYGSWMSTPVFVIVGLIAALFSAMAYCFLAILDFPFLGGLSIVFAAAMLALLIWISWIRRQYSSTGGGMMEKVHETVVRNLDFDGVGSILEVGCGSGALTIRLAICWPEARITGIDSWSAVYNYSREMCEQNAQLEGVADRCVFVRGNAVKLDFPDESFDAVVSNYVFHNIPGHDGQDLISESLRVLRKGGVFVFNDTMKKSMYKDMEEFAESLRRKGFKDVELVDTALGIFGSRRRAAQLMLGNSRMLKGRK